VYDDSGSHQHKSLGEKIRKSKFYKSLLGLATGAMIYAGALGLSNKVDSKELEEKIVFSSFVASTYEIYTINPDGSELKRIYADYNDIEPTWSPDGKEIAFVSDRIPFRPLSTKVREIYKMDVDGANQKRLTFNNTDDINPAWRPPRLRGDINGDGIINATDVQGVINSAIGIEPHASNPYTDLNRNGIINATDVQKVINVALGLYQE